MINLGQHSRRYRLAILSKSLPVLALAALALTGCSGSRDIFGGNKNQPDAMAVIQQAPLVVPPDYQLVPPKPGVPRPTEVDTSQQAMEALFGKDKRQVLPSPLEASILRKSGALKADQDIRTELRDEGAKVVSKADMLKELLDAETGDTDPETVKIGQ